MNTIKFLITNLEVQLEGLKLIAKMAPSDYGKGCIDTYATFIEMLKRVVEDEEKKKEGEGL